MPDWLTDKSNYVIVLLVAIAVTLFNILDTLKSIYSKIRPQQSRDARFPEDEG